MVALNDETRAHIDHWLAKFPPDRKRSAVLQGLHAAQEQNGGWLSDELIAAVAKYLGLPPVWAYEVASSTRCSRPSRSAATTSPSAPTSAAGSTAPKTWCATPRRSSAASSANRTADGRVFLKQEEECLAACCGAPMMVINGHYHENLTPRRSTNCWTD